MTRGKPITISLATQHLRVAEVDFKVLVVLIVRLSQIFLKISLVTLVVVPLEEQATEEMI